METCRMKIFFTLLFAVTIMPLLSACATPSQILTDAKVRELCEKDGGIKVYETVRLPAEKFRRYTQFLTTVPFQELKEDDEYYLVWNVSELKDGNPNLSSDHFQIIRRSDLRILGEATSYIRKGGDVPGPWHISSYRCPDKATDSFLIRRTFLIDEE